MTWIFLCFVLVGLTAVSARLLMSAVRTAPVRTADYSAMAGRVSRLYRVLSWAVVTAFLLSTLAQLFLQAIHEII